MDQKTIDTVDSLVSGFAKAKTLYQENAAMFKKLKTWFKENRTVIIIVAVVLGVAGYYVYRQYQESKEELSIPIKKTAVKEKPAVVMSETTDLKKEVVSES